MATAGAGDPKVNPVSESLTFFWALFGLLSLAAVVALYFQIVDLRQTSRLRSQSAQTAGTVARLWKQTGWVGKSTRTTSWMIDYSFAIETVPQTGSDPVDQASWERIHVGDTVTVYYLPADPSYNELVHNSQHLSGVFRLIAGFVGWVALSGFLLTQIDKYQKIAWVRDRGERRSAEVTGCERVSGPASDAPVYKIAALCSKRTNPEGGGVR